MIMIFLETKRKKPENILKRYPRAILADVTSKATDGLVKLSPFYPHGGIPVPFSEGYTATCVEAIWQGLKVFEHSDVDTSLFLNDTMKGIKRTVRKYGKPLGHRKGVYGTELLGYIDARKQISSDCVKPVKPRRSCCWTMTPMLMLMILVNLYLMPRLSRLMLKESIPTMTTTNNRESRYN